MTQQHDAEFTEYVAARWDRLIRSAVLLGCSPPDAEDLVQETVLRCYVAWDRVRRAGNVDAYVYRTLVNQHRDRGRRRWRGERPTRDLSRVTDASSASIEHTIDNRLVAAQAMAGLSRHQREVVVLRLYLDLSVTQAADVLDISAGTVKSRLARALIALSKNPAFDASSHVTKGGDHDG